MVSPGENSWFYSPWRIIVIDWFAAPNMMMGLCDYFFVGGLYYVDARIASYGDIS